MTRLQRILVMFGIGCAVAGSSTGVEPTGHSTKHGDTTPDAPQNFGYKVSWLTVRTRDAAAVIRTLALADTHPANWQTGIPAAYEGHQIFVSPPLDGWTFAVGFDLPGPDQSDKPGDPVGGRAFGRMFASLAQQFEEVQFFGSYRVAGYAAWARAKGGHIERIFSFADGTVYVNFGPQSAEEHALGFLDISGLAPDAAGKALFAAAEKRDKQQGHAGRDPLPDEQDVVDLAKAWSGIDPTELEQGHFDKGLGTVGLFPDGQ